MRIATLDESRQIVAVKLMRKLELEAAALERARREAVIMRRLRHRNIVRLFNVVETSVGNPRVTGRVTRCESDVRHSVGVGDGVLRRR